MSILQNSNAISAPAATGFYTHQIANSIRVSNSSANSSATNYLYRNGGAGNRDTWTIGMWIKRARIATSSSHTSMATWGGHSGSGSGRGYGMVNDYTGTINGMSFEDNNNSSWHVTTRTNAMYRDLSGWTHVCWRYDSTQGTDSSRARMYVNGELITNLQSTTYPAQNADHSWNGGGYQFIGTNGTGTNGNNPYQGFDGYIAEVVAIDGTSLDPMDNLVETKNGVIIPKDPSGLTFGSEGFYLKFESSGDLGNDSSGNNNDFTVAGISAHDQMLDSPTFGGSSSGNFPTLNPLFKHENMTFSEGNLKHSTSTNDRGVMCNIAIPKTGKWYWEHLSVAFHNPAGNETHNVGINIASVNIDGSDRGGRATGITYASYNGGKSVEADSTASYGTGWAEGDIVGVEFDADNGTINFSKNGSWQGDISLTTAQKAKEWFPFVGMGGASNQEIGIFNFGADSSFSNEKTSGSANASDDNGFGSFYYSPPSGALALTSANLPVADAIDPAETDDDYPQKLFAPKLYTGDGASTLAISGMDFKPDFTWIKARNDTSGHKLFDSTRGVTKYVASDSTALEVTASNTLKSWTSDGFTVGDESGVNYNSSTNYVSYNWRANGGNLTTNTQGSEDSTVQVDPSGGFSIVTYTGTQSNATIGHGLSSAPKCILVKCRDFDRNWAGLFVNGPGNGTSMILNSNSYDTSSGYWNNTNPTSTVFSIGGGTETNKSGKLFVAYCFANTEGYIKSGTYVGNGNNDGTFVYTGHKPAFLLIREVAQDNWLLYNNKTLGYNLDSAGNAQVYPDTSSAEENQASRAIDLYSNGFKLRTSNATGNASGGNYIYLSISSNPFKYATAR